MLRIGGTDEDFLLFSKNNTDIKSTTNAKQLMEYTISQGYKVNWELGNGTSVLCVYQFPLDNVCYTNS